MNGQRVLRVSRYNNQTSCWTYQIMEDGKPVDLPANGSPVSKSRRKVLAESLGLDGRWIKIVTDKYVSLGSPEFYEVPVADIKAAASQRVLRALRYKNCPPGMVIYRIVEDGREISESYAEDCISDIRNLRKLMAGLGVTARDIMDVTSRLLVAEAEYGMEGGEFYADRPLWTLKGGVS